MTARRHRVRLRWFVEWNSKTEKCSIEKWTRSFISQNLWRCDPIHELEDLLQDAYLTFLKIIDYYPRTAIAAQLDPRNFMSLYMRAITNKMHDHARLVRKKRDVYGISDQEDQLHNVIGEVTNAGYLNTLLAEAPEELRMAMAVMESNPAAIREEGFGRENLNMKIRRALRSTTEFDFLGSLRTILS